MAIQYDAAPAVVPRPIEEMRQVLRGRRYVPAVGKILPKTTPWVIRNTVNGRNKNPHVLQALEIVVRNLEQCDRENNTALKRALAASD